MILGGNEHLCPQWMDPFWAANRYKAAYGGRGSGKSWGFARMALVRGRHKPLRILCARELQASIKDSVHALLADQVDKMGVAADFETGKSFVRGRNGTEFLFKGLRHNTTEIKSMEGVDICWVEEGQSVSEDSWKLLIPTIRKAGSEIWVTFNPDEATDPTYKRFVTNPPPGCVVRMVNWQDNPWFPPELDAERRHMLSTDPDAYDHVWEGKCRSLSDAQVLRGKYRVDVFSPEPDWDGPYYGADWGFANDPTVLVRMWVHDRRLYIENEAYGVGVELDDTPDMFRTVPDSERHTIRADSARPESISYIRRNGFPGIKAVEKWPGSVEDGVSYLRSFKAIVIHDRCKHTREEARLWRYKTDRLTGDVRPELVDAHNHCWDSVRYGLEPIIKAKGQILVW